VNVQITFYLNIPDDNLKEILSRAAVMVYAPVLEPFGLAPLEANACGTYVVAVAEGGVRETISNGINGSLVDGFKPDELATQISDLILDLKNAKTRGLESRRYVEKKWNNERLARNILTEIEKFFSDMRKDVTR
jgi:glycosyltransferase involved in cell wall biosynthesis